LKGSKSEAVQDDCVNQVGRFTCQVWLNLWINP